MPVYHQFFAGSDYYIFDANASACIKVDENLYKELINYSRSGYKDTTPSIETMIERGYLRDRNDFEMIHPMAETLESALARSVPGITLQVTQNCNLHCKYCAYSGSYHNRTHTNKRMSKKVAFKAIDFLFEHSMDADLIGIGFYGGEPLLEMDLIKECVSYAKEKFIGKELLFTITTNATLITDDMLTYLYKNQFSLTISLDGDQSAHDRNRVFAVSNNGTFNAIIKALDKLREKHPDYIDRVSINAVIDPAADFSCTSSFFANYDSVRDFFVQSTLISDNYSKEDRVDVENYICQFSYEMFKLFLHKLGRLDKSNVSKLVLIEFTRIQDMHDRSRNSYTTVTKDHHSGPCTPGIRKLFVDVDGNLYPCERVSETSKAVRMGHIDSGFDIEKAIRLLNIGQLTEKECKQCWVFRFCTSCAVAADSLDELSADAKLKNCENVRSYFENVLKDYCVLRNLGYNFDSEKVYERSAL